MRERDVTFGTLVAIASLTAVSLAAPGFSAGREQLPGKTQTVVAGEQYKNAPGSAFLFGADYRQLWATPIEVEVLDLRAVGGGLSPVMRVGGNQTKGLAMKGQDGLSYTFRSVDKSLSAILPEPFKGTPIELIFNDQIAGNFPGVQVVTPPLAEAAGVLHPDIRLVVMPDDPALGEYQEDFANVLGVFMEYPQVGFQGSTEILGHEEFWTRRQAGPSNLADSQAFLRARLLDVLLGDWDRHRGQWRWAKIPGEPRLQALPEDRDQVFADWEGKALDIARLVGAQMPVFRDEYVSIYDATQNGWDLDRFLLTDLEKAEWMEIAADLQARITDDVIDTALRRMPTEYYELTGAEIDGILRRRRDQLTDVAEKFYDFLVEDVDVHGSDRSEIMTVERLDGNDVTVSVAVDEGNQTPAEAYFHRRFKGDETKEVRIYLHGGNNRVVVRGNETGGPKIRVIGGPANDVVDTAQGGKVDFYDFEGNNRVEGPGGINTKSFVMPPRMTGDPEEQWVPWTPTRDWGRTTVPRLVLGYHSDPGLVVGGGFDTQSHAFRKYPWANRHILTGAFAIGSNEPLIDYIGDYRRENSRLHFALLARYSGIEQLRYFGAGNETTKDLPRNAYEITNRQVSIFPALTPNRGETSAFFIGPILKYSDSTATKSDTVLAQEQPIGSGKFGQIGVHALTRYNSRLNKNALAGGFDYTAEGSYYPQLWDVESDFGSISGTFTGYVPLSDSVTLTARAGGKKVWGDYPYYEGAYVGGARTLYGYNWNRFVGDASLHGLMSVRWAFKKIRTVFPGEFGLLAAADAGRVFLKGEDSSKWHSSYGGGIFYAPFARHFLVDCSCRSERRGYVFRHPGEYVGIGPARVTGSSPSRE